MAGTTHSPVSKLLLFLVLRLAFLSALLVDRRVGDALGVFLRMAALFFTLFDVFGLTIFLVGKTAGSTRHGLCLQSATRVRASNSRLCAMHSGLIYSVIVNRLPAPRPNTSGK